MKINLILSQKKKLIAKKMKGLVSYRAKKCIRNVEISHSAIH